MSVFAVLSRIPNPKLEAQIVKEFPQDHYKLSENQWLVCAGGTSVELAQKLGIIDKDKAGTTGNALVLGISSYWGVENPDLWEWLKVKWEKNCA